MPAPLKVSAGIALFTCFAGPGLAQTPATPSRGPVPILSQTIRGVEVHLSDIQWSPFDVPQSSVPFFKSFYLAVHVAVSPGMPLPMHTTPLNYVTAVTAVSPDGGLLNGDGGGMSYDSAGALETKTAYWNDDIDPRWPLVGIDVDFLDPAAPPRATGRSVGPITITGIPVPTEFDQVMPVHAETTTPLGTKIIVEKVKVSPNAKRDQTTFVFQVVPDPEAADLQFSFSTGSKVSDDTGVRLNPKSGGTAGGSDLLDPQAVYNSEIRSLAITGIPAPGAKTMTLTLDATESSEMLKQDKWYRHFHLLVPLNLLDTRSRRPYSSLAVTEGKQVTVTLESITPQEKRYRTRFTLRDLTKSGITWQLRVYPKRPARLKVM